MMRFGTWCRPLAAAALVFIGVYAYARVTGTAPSDPDVACYGRSGAEVCVEYAGNFIPTTDNDTTLGTSSLAWATIYAYDLTLSDDLTVTDDVTVTDALTVNGSATLGNASADVFTLNGGTMVVRNNSQAVQIGTSTTDGTYILNIDGANRRLGIGNSAPTVELDVTGSITASGVVKSTSPIVTAGGMRFFARTKAQFDALDPITVGETYVCSDCTEVLLCVSTGTAVAQFQRVDSATAGCGTGE